MRRSFSCWTWLAAAMVVAGCGSEAATSPAALTAEEEQEILDQVNASAHAEQGHSVEQ